MEPLLPLGTRSAYGTEVPVVPNVKPVLPGASRRPERAKAAAADRNCIFGRQTERIVVNQLATPITGENRESHFGRTWDRRSRNLARHGRHGLGANKIEDHEEDCRRKNRPRGR